MASQPSFRAVQHVRRPRLSDTITDQIEDLIAAGKLRPGDRLPPERDLAQQLDVSRPSLREALLILESRGLLQARRGGGFSVTDVTAPTITDPLVHLLQRHPETVDDILELRHGLECVAAEFAAVRATEADDKRLREIVGGMKRRRGPVDPLDPRFNLPALEHFETVGRQHLLKHLRAAEFRPHPVMRRGGPGLGPVPGSCRESTSGTHGNELRRVQADDIWDAARPRSMDQITSGRLPPAKG